MSKIRKAHSVELIERRLKDAESATVDAMELVSLEDELSRVERKWREQIAEGSDRRQPNDIPRLNAYFDRLQKQLEAALRRSPMHPAEQSLLQNSINAIQSRSRS